MLLLAIMLLCLPFVFSNISQNLKEKNQIKRMTSDSKSNQWFPPSKFWQRQNAAKLVFNEMYDESPRPSKPAWRNLKTVSKRR